MDPETLFYAVVRRLQKESTHLVSQWLEPWLELQAEHTEAKGVENGQGCAPHVTPAGARETSEEKVPQTPQRAVLSIVHNIATLKAHACTSAEARAQFRAAVASTSAFEARVGHLVPGPFAPVAMLLENALADLEGREMAMRGLLELCDTTYLPELQKGTECTATRQHVQLYKKLKTELKRVFFTLSVEIVPWLREFSGWYRTHRGVETAVVDAARARPKQSGASRACDERCNTDDDDQQVGSKLLQVEMARSPSLVEIPVDEAALQEYERQRKQDIQQVGQQIRELRELQEYANTLVAEQGQLLDVSEEQAEAALDNATASRIQLSLAAKYKLAGAALTGALVGGLLGGPLGLIAGAKSASTIGLVALGGGVTGGVVGRTVASSTAARAAAVDETYEEQQEQRHAHSK